MSVEKAKIRLITSTRIFWRTYLAKLQCTLIAKDVLTYNNHGIKKNLLISVDYMSEVASYT